MIWSAQNRALSLQRCGSTVAVTVGQEFAAVAVEPGRLAERGRMLEGSVSVRVAWFRCILLYDNEESVREDQVAQDYSWIWVSMFGSCSPVFHNGMRHCAMRPWWEGHEAHLMIVASMILNANMLSGIFSNSK